MKVPYTDLNFVKKPELPKIEIKKGKNLYSVPFITYLNENAIIVIDKIFSKIINENESSLVRVNYEKSDIEKVEIIADIVSSLIVFGKRKYKNGFFAGIRFLVEGYTINKYKDDAAYVEFPLIKEQCEALRKYAEGIEGKISFAEAAIYVFEEVHNDLPGCSHDKK